MKPQSGDPSQVVVQPGASDVQAPIDVKVSL